MQSSKDAQVSYPISARRVLSKVTIFTTIALLGVAFISETANASLFGIFSTASEIESQDSYVRDIENSQTITLLQSAKNIDPNPSRGGAEVYLAENVALVSESTPFETSSEEQVAPPLSDQISMYLVREGDTLSQVAKMFNVSVNTVVWANQLSSNKDIHPGQTLLILPVSGVQLVVKKGDTLKGLAKKYAGDEGEIIAYNNLLEDGVLTVGSTITIPGGEIPEEKSEEKKSKSGAKYIKVATGNTNVSGYFTHPVPGSIKTQGLHGYNAIDFGAPSGTPILAAAEGKVVVSRVGGWNGGYGNYIVIEHPNGTQTLYAHNSENAVWQGKTVAQGQVIGYVGTTGRSTGNHLHFEVRGAKNPF